MSEEADDGLEPIDLRESAMDSARRAFAATGNPLYLDEAMLAVRPGEPLPGWLHDGMQRRAGQWVAAARSKQRPDELAKTVRAAMRRAIVDWREDGAARKLHARLQLHSVITGEKLRSLIDRAARITGDSAPTVWRAWGRVRRLQGHRQ